MDDFEKSLNSRLQNPEFKKEWNSLQLEYQNQSSQIGCIMESDQEISKDR